MQNYFQGSQPESPRSVLPPLSKYYYGPAQGRASPQRLANDEASNLGTTSPTNSAPPLPPRHLAGAESFSAAQWMNHFAGTEQLWQLPGPPASAPPASHDQTPTYNPIAYGPMPGHRLSPKAAGDTAKPAGGSNLDHHGTEGGASAQAEKPPLPPRPSALATETLPSESATHTEYLPSVSYKPMGGQAAFDQHHLPLHSNSDAAISPPPPHRFPPPPPPKLPPDDDENEDYREFQQARQQVPLSPTRQMSQPPSMSSRGQNQPLPTYDPSKDHVTYSIPSSIWRQEQITNSGEQSLSQADSYNEPQRSDSFYWQSPHSSIHSAKDEDNTTGRMAAADQVDHSQQSNFEAENQRKDSDTLATPSFLSRSTIGSYGASALGFGGPSDWEHFGDYEAEEIDDTDLYTRAKPAKPAAEPHSAELPAPLLKSGSEVVNQSTAAHLDTSSSVSAYPLTGERLGNVHVPGPAEVALTPEEPANRVSHEEKPDGALNHYSESANLKERTAQVNVTSPSLDLGTSDTFAIDLDETIQVWSKANSMENLKDSNPTELAIERSTNSPHLPKSADDNSDANSATHTSNTLDVSESNSLKSVPQSTGNGSVPRGYGSENDASSDIPMQIQLQQASVAPNAISEVDQANDKISASMDQANSNQSKLLAQERPTLVAIPGISAKAKETEDPYAGLDAWGKASLNRYIAMLREESEANTDKEKLNIFTVFTGRETRLRAVLYGEESEPSSNQLASSRTGSIKRANTVAFKRASKALPALPREQNNSAPLHSNGHARKSSVKISATAVLGAQKPKPTGLEAIDTTKPSTPDNEESPIGIQFSPGGRPIVPHTSNTDRMSYTSASEPSVVATAGQGLPAKSPVDLDTPVFREPLSEGQPDSNDASAYKPFKYNDGRSEAHNYAANRQSKRQSQFRPYAAKATGSDEYREMFLTGNPRDEASIEVPLTDTHLPASNKSREEAEPDLRRFIRADFDPLLTVLPESGEVRVDPVQLSGMKQVADSLPDEFGFIHQSVVIWDGKARRQREINERERHARQVESEQKIDALFDDHEIGYGDISELESGFKRSEAARKANEDRSEYKTFVVEVFNVVWARLHYEIDQLSPHYTEYTKILNIATAGKDMFDVSAPGLALAPAMDALLTLHQKLEIRHQKAFEAVLERDRRLKKTELSPLYSLGNVSQVKQLEKQFEDAEKKAIVEYCRQRDIRANSLMDVLDQNTLRGVGANQDYMEMVMKAVRRIASGRAFASQPGDGEPGVGLDEVTKAKMVTKALATSSEQVVQTFHVADMLLNAADYELSVAKAKFSGADAITFQTLKEERAKEDQKLMRDLEHRLALIREDSRRTHDEIVKLLLFLGVQNGHARSSPCIPQTTDLEHEERLHKALEEAKKRNASKDSGALAVS